MLHGPKQTQHRASKLRRTMTLPEVILWQELRKRPAGLKFRRQHPAGRYVLDFFCASHHLAIEVDGEAHNRSDRPQRDGERDAWLAAQHIRVCRIPAMNVLTDLDAVIVHILSWCGVRGNLPLHQPSAGPPPPPGEN
ncbi:endonuclease domain-containing protein [Sphingomonas sp. BT553]|uniref:Endonuclease domain-containing protein n=2 Tax=Sphingomonas mollis TaxID=2795726 RepID=A0ABS0XQ19_9SPHN|nr:endonuclease domain-containing protein [Sphingomonas sp. BT553]MBJ6122141.1 endonuclease domain-containing protein [Sphingomonas sp. BT553]